MLRLKMVRLTASLVVFETPAAELEPLFLSLQQSETTWVAVDNSAGQGEVAAERKRAVLAYGGIYLASPGNVGFGAGHNLGLLHLQRQGIDSHYHLIVNPDIEFGATALCKLVEVLDSRPDAGWIMPQVRFQNGDIQPLCKLLPTPMDLFGRRFLPKFARSLWQAREDEYELRGGENTISTTVPFLSGCFILARRDLLQRTGGFDERYFMYMEDVDLCRRFVKFGKLLYWPEVSVVHGFHRGSHHDLRLTLLHVRSAIRYFNRWGWLRDPERVAANRSALRALEQRSVVKAVPSAPATLT